METMTTDEEEYFALQKRILHLIQDGNAEEADKILQENQFTHRLASCVLKYPFEGEQVPFPIDPIASKPFVCAADNALPLPMLEYMEHAFSSSSSTFWDAHQYSVDPPSPYFSYVHDLSQPPQSGLEDVIHQLKALAMARFPTVKRATFAEWWTHCRPHPSGHQFHFDSADEGRGGVRNPIVSTVLFLEAPCGGPTCVTDQRFGFSSLGRHGWLVHPKENRFVVFNGKVLHGVVPGRGPGPETSIPNPRRVTFMVAFWDFDVRQGPVGPGERPGSAMPLDWEGNEEWKQRLLPRCVVDESQKNEVTEVEPIPVANVWERTNGSPLDNKMPKYDVCFQGF